MQPPSVCHRCRLLNPSLLHGNRALALSSSKLGLSPHSCIYAETLLVCRTGALPAWVLFWASFLSYRPTLCHDTGRQSEPAEMPFRGRLHLDCLAAAL